MKTKVMNPPNGIHLMMMGCFFGLLISYIPVADAAGGCGVKYHRLANGVCVLNKDVVRRNCWRNWRGLHCR